MEHNVKYCGWDSSYLDKWDKDHEVNVEEARQRFHEEQRELKEVEVQEAAQRQADADAQADDDGEKCWSCGEAHPRSDTDVIISCRGDGCSSASHLQCCSPPLEEVPEGNVSTLTSSVSGQRICFLRNERVG